VGLGPYHLDRWEPGAFLEASAFDRHVLGVPRINRIKLVFMLDSNVALASMLAREVQMASDNGLPLAQTSSLLRQWPAGSAVMVPSYLSWLAAHFQNRPDFVSPPALRDVRVRRALAHAVDRDGINDSLFESQLGIADTMFPLTSDLGRAAAAAATKYPFDLVRSAQLMADAGFTRPAAEPYLGPDGERLTVEVRTGSASDVATQTALASGWRQAGFEFQEVVVPPAQSQDTRVKASFPGLQVGLVGVGEAAIDGMGSANIPGPSNQWRGRAWDGLSNPELDRLVEAFPIALDPLERTQVAVDIVKIYSRELPALSLFHNVTPWVFTSEVKGPNLRPADSNPSWNIYEWELAGTYRS
jgi:peptide/nickel transport system substrate-binding protein